MQLLEIFNVVAPSIAAAVGLAWRVDGRMDKIERSLDRLLGLIEKVQNATDAKISFIEYRLNALELKIQESAILSPTK